MGQSCDSCNSPSSPSPKAYRIPLDITTDSDNDDDTAPTPMSQEMIDSTIEGWKSAIEKGNDSYIDCLIGEYPQINFFDVYWDDGTSSLMNACKHRKARVVYLLLNEGAIVNEQNPETLDTALHFAVRAKDEKIVGLQTDQWDADPNMENRQQQTPISIASQLDDKTIYGKLKRTALRGAMLSPNSLACPQTSRQKTNALRMFSLTQQAMHATAESILNANDESAVPFSEETIVSASTLDSICEKSKETVALPKLQAWLEKQQPRSIMRNFQRRWIIVAGAYILWSDKRRAISDDASREERSKFKGSIHLMGIKRIAPIISANNHRFMVKAKDAKTGQMREYIFRCQDKEMRDYWVDGLKQHKSQYETLMNYLEK